MPKFFKQSKTKDPKDISGTGAFLLADAGAGVGMGLGQSVASTMFDPENELGPKREKMPKKV
jgi:hypothetical protein